MVEFIAFIKIGTL